MKNEITKTETVAKKIKKFIGMVISDKMDKTCVVEITRKEAHPIYLKTYLKSRRIKAHDEANSIKIGDKVEIAETRPYSKTKSWKVIRVISTKAPATMAIDPELEGSVK